MRGPKALAILCLIIAAALLVVWIVVPEDSDGSGTPEELSPREVERLWMELREQVYVGPDRVDLEKYKNYVLSYPGVATVYRWNGPNEGYENTLAQLFHMAIWGDLDEEQRAKLAKWEVENKGTITASDD